MSIPDRHASSGASSATPAIDADSRQTVRAHVDLTPDRATARKRRELIADLLQTSDRVSVAWLAEHFAVSDVSIRRDLTVLEDAGRLRRVHGAAIPASSGEHERGFAVRARQNREAKKRIGAAAAGLIKPGNVVVLDSGSTVAQVAAHISARLRRQRALTVVANSIPILSEVGSWDDPDLICLGGLYLPDYQAIAGPQAVAALRGLSTDIVFLGCDGLSIETGVTTPHVLMAEFGAVAASRARKVVVVADGTKIGRSGFIQIVPLGAVDALVTDDSADSAVLDQARELGVEVVLA